MTWQVVAVRRSERVELLTHNAQQHVNDHLRCVLGPGCGQVALWFIQVLVFNLIPWVIFHVVPG